MMSEMTVPQETSSDSPEEDEMTTRDCDRCEEEDDALENYSVIVNEKQKKREMRKVKCFESDE
jgi:hypothetical protein